MGTLLAVLGHAIGIELFLALAVAIGVLALFAGDGGRRILAALAASVACIALVTVIVRATLSL